MKRIPMLKTLIGVISVLFLSLSLLQCTKNDGLIRGLDRSYVGIVDSTIFAPFYDTTTITPSDLTPDVNDKIVVRSVRTIIREYCATSNCHGGAIAPSLLTYNDVMKYVTPLDPNKSKLWEFITTNDFNKAMPPVNSNHELSGTDKSMIFNWIINGAKEVPDLKDFRPAAVRIIVDGCGSANCHNQATATGGWARKGLLGTLTTADTTTYTYINPTTGAITLYCQLSNETLRNQVWGAYKDSVRKFYADTVANASFRPYMIFGTPVSALSTRGPLQNYDDILLDINYPKTLRSYSYPVYTDPVTLKKYYVIGNNLNFTTGRQSSLISRVDSTLLLAHPVTGVYLTAQQGDMAYGDGGLKPSEIALIKAWYFADPNVPTVWKYGNANAGIFKYRKSGTVIKQ